jgi:hypothetical protein
MSSILKPLSEAEKDLAQKDALVLQVAEATNHLAVTLKQTNDQFWSLPTERLLAVLNADVISTLNTFAANTAIGQAVNDSLDALSLPQYSTRAPLLMGRRDIKLDGGTFVLVPEKPVDESA